MPKLPLGLRQALESGDCVLFIGAGVGGNFHRPDGTTAPDGETLAKELCARFDIAPESSDLAKVAQLVEIRKNRSDLESFLKKRLADLEPDDSVKWLTTFRWRAIYTTNYDYGIVRAYESSANAPQMPVPISLTSELEYTNPQIQVPVYYLHGTLFGPGPSHIVVTQDDYSRYQTKRRMLWQRLKMEFATSTILYLGYSGRDPNWRLVLDELTQEFLPSKLPPSFRVDPFAETIDVEILKHQGIETVSLDLSGFRDAAEADLAGYRPDPDALAKYRQGIPADLAPAFNGNPTAILRLLNSWEYANAANFTEAPNTSQFLRGEPPSWSLVARQIQFKRDLEDEVWDDALDFATNPAGKSGGVVVIAPAGYGVTTFLKTIAARIVKDNVGPVFMLRPGARVLEADVAIASTLFPDSQTYFVVDQAHEQAAGIATSLSQVAENCMFVLGERKNEWKMTRTNVRLSEYEILPLSDEEIDRLLNYLARENALGKLAELDREFQFSIIKNKHEKELLVALREATEGRSFDAIIEDEYRGVQELPNGALAADVYLLVSCFYQHGILARDHLIAAIMNKPLQDLYKELEDSLEGIVSFVETDLARGEYAARTRHRVIADVVWKRCGELGMKERVLRSAMEHLNLSYRLDKAVFERFVRSDEVVDNFRSLDGKTGFFETACLKDPGNPYVLQHYARMLRRERQLNLALSQIDAALGMNESVRVFHHTRGMILADLALGAESRDVGRKWLYQSEREYQRCIETNSRDHYGYTGLAQLYLDWANRISNEDEASDYITKCEEVISDGLRQVRDRDGLWIVSADVQKFLGNNPGRIAKLKKAVQENAKSVIPRYLLGREYRSAGEPDKCIEVLTPVVTTHFREFRSFVEYVRAMVDMNQPYSKCIAVLTQAQLDGLTDPSFVGLLGGLYFAEGKFEEARKTFSESTKQGFDFERRRMRVMRLTDKGTQVPSVISGRVATVSPGFAYLQSDKFPDVRSRATRVGKVALQKGMRVRFELSFSPGGPFAENLRLDT